MFLKFLCYATKLPCTEMSLIDASAVNDKSVHCLCCYKKNDFDLCLRIKSHFNLYAYVFKTLIADSKNRFLYICFPLKELKKYGVTTLVRVCDATYDKAPVEKEGIHVLVSV